MAYCIKWYIRLNILYLLFVSRSKSFQFVELKAEQCADTIGVLAPHHGGKKAGIDIERKKLRHC